MFKKLASGILDILYPKNCILCKTGIFDEENQFYLCENFLANIKRNLPPFCLNCGRHLEKDEIDDTNCKQCRKRQFYFDCSWSVCIFDDIIKDLIHKFKYSNKTRLAKMFAKLIFDFLTIFNLTFIEYSIMLPVPLHPVRLREREYNQCEILAKELQRFIPIMILTKDVIRIRNTKPQVLLDRQERWKNIKDAFQIKRPENFKSKNVLIIDDLITTGATVSELARTLKDAGANKVSVLTLAITK
jgi:ComF family protein